MFFGKMVCIVLRFVGLIILLGKNFNLFVFVCKVVKYLVGVIILG